MILFTWFTIKSKFRTTAPDQPKPDQAFSRLVSLALLVGVWAPRPEDVAELKSDVALNIAAALTEAGIKVPVPQVQIRTGDQKPMEAVAV